MTTHHSPYETEGELSGGRSIGGDEQAGHRGDISQHEIPYSILTWRTKIIYLVTTIPNLTITLLELQIISGVPVLWYGQKYIINFINQNNLTAPTNGI